MSIDPLIDEMQSVVLENEKFVSQEKSEAFGLANFSGLDRFVL